VRGEAASNRGGHRRDLRVVAALARHAGREHGGGMAGAAPADAGVGSRCASARRRGGSRTRRLRPARPDVGRAVSIMVAVRGPPCVKTCMRWNSFSLARQPVGLVVAGERSRARRHRAPRRRGTSGSPCRAASLGWSKGRAGRGHNAREPCGR
jgi:hypothetical protein